MKEMDEKNIIPGKYKTDIERAIQILKKSGCKEIFIFGSIVKNNESEKSDIDIAVRGIDPEKYFYLWGKLATELVHSVDLINLERDDRFCRLLIESGELVRVA